MEVEKKLAAKEEELKANKVKLVAKAEELEKARVEVRQLGEELTRLREEVRSLRPQLEQAKVATTKSVSEFQASEEMAATKKPSYERASKHVRVPLHTPWRRSTSIGTWPSLVRN